MTEADLNYLINRLQRYQDWRRGKDDDFDPDPKLIGEDIDAAIEVCKMVSEMFNMINRDEKNQASGKSLPKITFPEVPA